MAYGEADNEAVTDTAMLANGVPGSLQAQMHEAFREWLEASKAWSTLCRTVEVDEGDSSAAKRELRKMERRLNAAADAFNQILQRFSEYSRA